MKTLHVEASTYCNARCPLCPRSLYGYKVDGVYPETHLKVDKFQECLDLFPDRTLVYFNGNLGDPMMNPDILSLAELTDCETSITTNGSIGSKETCFGCLNRISLIMDRRRWTSQMPNTVNLNSDRFSYIMTDKLKIWMTNPLTNVSLTASRKIIKAQNLLTRPHQTIYQTGAKKTRTTSNQVAC